MPKMNGSGPIDHRSVFVCRHHTLKNTLEQLNKDIQVSAKETIAFFIA
jgi:hypothetical protein